MSSYLLKVAYTTVVVCRSYPVRISGVPLNMIEGEFMCKGGGGGHVYSEKNFDIHNTHAECAKCRKKYTAKTLS